MNLLQRHEGAIARMKSLQAGRGDIDESEALAQFAQQQLLPALARLSRIDKVKTALDDREIHAGLAPPSKTLRDAATALRERFEREAVRAALVDGKGWESVKPSLQAYCEQSQQRLQGSWSTYCDTRIPEDTPEQLRADSVISMHRENRAMLQQYEFYYTQLIALKATFPVTSNTIDQFHKAAREAASVLKQINRQQPPPEALPPEVVKAFFQMISAGPVGLDKVPPEALDWLRAQGRLGDYQLRPSPA